MNQAVKPKQQRFVDEYLVSLNATQAAIKAGYSVKCAKEQGHRLLTYAHIQEKIAATNDEHMESTGVTKQWILLNLKSIIERAMAEEPVLDANGNKIGVYKFNGSVALKGVELAGKHLGLFATKATTSSHHQETLLDLI